MAGSSPNVDHLLDAGRVRWNDVGFDVLCSRCDYNLRGLEQPRCPECGLEFEWADMFRAAFTRNNLLFEHYGSKRLVRSLAKTIWRSFRPKRFWASVSIHDPIRAGPLWFLLFLSIVALLIGFHGAAELVRWTDEARDAFAGRRGPRSFQGSRYYFLARELGLRFIISNPIYWRIPASVIAFSLAVLVFLSSLRQTLGRCRVRSAQILRVLAYMAVPAYLISGILLFAMALFETTVWRPSPLSAWGMIADVSSPFLVAMCVPAWYVGVGLQHYLKLPRARLLSWVAHVVAGLFVAALLFYLSLWGR